MANKLNYNDLLKYMEIVLDMEKNIYIQEQTISQVEELTNGLGIARSYTKPQAPQKPKMSNTEQPHKEWKWVSTPTAYFEDVALLVIIITLIVVIAVPLIVGLGNIFRWVFSNFFVNIFLLAVGIIAFPLILLFIFGFIIDAKEKKRAFEKYKLEEEAYQKQKIAQQKSRENTYQKNLAQYNQSLNQYNQNLENDKQRVQRELAQKQYLEEQCDMLTAILKTSKAKLEEIYGYDILEKKYRNMVAVASLYEYLKHERTRSLQRTGNDEGAYNIYEMEIRLDRIVTNTDTIIQELDTVIKNQYEIADRLREAKGSIDNLVESVDRASRKLSDKIGDLMTSTNNMSAKLQSGMNRLNASVELSNYQQEQTNRELRYMNTMNTLHFYS